MFQKSVAWEAKQLAVRPFPLAREPPESCRLPKIILRMNENLCDTTLRMDGCERDERRTDSEHSSGIYRQLQEMRGN